MYCIEDKQRIGLLRNWEELNPEDTKDQERELIEPKHFFNSKWKRQIKNIDKNGATFMFFLFFFGGGV